MLCGPLSVRQGARECAPCRVRCFALGDCDRANPLVDLDLAGDGLTWTDDLDVAVNAAIASSCNGQVDEAGAVDARVWYGDLDGDEACARTLCEGGERCCPESISGGHTVSGLLPP
jgi:hypothetical protein